MATFSTLSKILAKLFNEYDEDYSDFEFWMLATARGYFNGIDVSSMENVVTLGDLYTIVVDAVDKL